MAPEEYAKRYDERTQKEGVAMRHKSKLDADGDPVYVLVAKDQVEFRETFGWVKSSIAKPSGQKSVPAGDSKDAAAEKAAAEKAAAEKKTTAAKTTKKS